MILDEAQAIKNADAESAKAARLLRGRHIGWRCGTPIENHLGELWTLFEFLNPGMLGSASRVRRHGAAPRNPTRDARHPVAGRCAPSSCAAPRNRSPELPTKPEQTIYCELEPRAARSSTTSSAALPRGPPRHDRGRRAWARRKIQVLEALLRLRQAACHPGLIDKKRARRASAKLDVLLAAAHEVVEEGHKALVFSQFTSFLAIVRDRLDAGGVPYEYLDGKTRDRQARVSDSRTTRTAGCS